ncbi:hypothetical protein [Paraburkholderia susongensis]|uniref:hypothetical protein n=1 Tax=Paraburkholderia susongensis TaxID=1515439 RepID=UPI000A1CE8B9|nr:hypothetical protein [Paraburkholderia susongensis]
MLQSFSSITYRKHLRAFPSPKQLLLPMPTEVTRHISLSNHLALVGIARRYQLKHSFNEVIRITYLSYFLWETGFGDADIGLFEEAERVMDSATDRATKEDAWFLDEAELTVLKRVVSHHDSQLDTVSAKAYFEATYRLNALLGSKNGASPIRKRTYTKSVNDTPAKDTLLVSKQARQRKVQKHNK